VTANAQSSSAIAGSVFIVLTTGKTHVASIQLKLRLRNRVEIAAWAWESRLAESDPDR
jgi:DNA-binding CsgD family transcriptional regulator